jgi:hypothetical protein
MHSWIERWIAPLVLGAGLVTLIWSIATPEAQRSYFQWGVSQVSVSYDQAIPFATIGVALTSLSPIMSVVSSFVVLIAFALGLFVQSSFLPFIGPLSLVLAGLLLITFRYVGAWTVPPIAALVAFTVAMTMSYDAPPADNWISYVAGGAQFGAWLIVLAMLLWQMLPYSLSLVAAPILGSWLLAIGSLIEGAMFVEPPQDTSPSTSAEPPIESQ